MGAKRIMMIPKMGDAIEHFETFQVHAAPRHAARPQAVMAPMPTAAASRYIRALTATNSFTELIFRKNMRLVI